MWKVTFSNKTKRGTGFNRNAEEGEFMVELEPSICGWVYATPERYQFVDGEFSEYPGWESESKKKELYEMYNSILTDIDNIVAGMQKENFEYNGVKFYVDADFIHKTRTRMDSLPDQAVIIWKSADKLADGITNVEVSFTKPEFIALSDALYDKAANEWYMGEELKKHLKVLCKKPDITLEDLKNFKADFVDMTTRPVDTTTPPVSGGM